MWHRHTKWVNAIGIMALLDLLDRRLPQIFNLQKMHYLQSTRKQNSVTQVLPVSLLCLHILYKNLLIWYCGYFLLWFVFWLPELSEVPVFTFTLQFVLYGTLYSNTFIVLLLIVHTELLISCGFCVDYMIKFEFCGFGAKYTIKFD